MSTGPADRPAFDLAPRDAWAAVTLHGEHVGFQHLHVAEGVLTVRTGFAPTAEQRRANPDLPERFLSQTRVSFSADGATWAWAEHEDSAVGQRVRIDRERAGLPADTVPTAAEHLLVPAAVEAGGAGYARLEEPSPLQGGLRMPAARIRVAADSGAGGDSGARVQLVVDGQVLATHVVTDGEVRSSDWGGGTVSALAESREAALDGLDAHAVTFAGMPLG